MKTSDLTFVPEMFAPGMLISSEIAASMAQKAYEKWKELQVKECPHLRVEHVELAIFECVHCRKRLLPKGWQEA